MSYTNEKYINIIKLFDVLVLSYNVLIYEDEIVSIEVHLDVSNDNIKHIEKEFANYLGAYIQEVSVIKGDQRALYFNNDKTGFLIDA